MRTHRLSPAGSIVLLVLLSACGGNGAVTEEASQQTANRGGAPATAEVAPGPVAGVAGWPPFPGDNRPAEPSTGRRTSGIVSFTGDGRVAEGGLNNYADPSVPNAYVIAPGGDDDLLAWAWYTVPDLDTERPVSVDLHITAAPIVPGGDDDLPLCYWVGLSDYTQFSWQWLGPYTAAGPLSISLNDEAQDIIDRYVSSDAGGNAFYLVLATPVDELLATPQNPQGLTAARIETVTLNTLDVNDPGYAATKPHYAAIETVSAPGGGKGVSALDPLQYVELSWTHVYDPYDSESEAVQYRLYRQGPMDPQRIPIGAVNAPTAVYVDPTDNAPGIAEAVPGATYKYWLRAFNPQGYTPYNQGQYTIPLLGPADVQATDGIFSDRIRLTWTRAEGATGYKIYRDGQSEAELAASIGDVAAWNDTTVKDYAIHTYRVRSTNQYMPEGGGWSVEDTGFRVLPGPTDVQASDGAYGNRIAVTWAKAPDATGYKIYRDGQSEAELIATLGDVARFDDMNVPDFAIHTYWLRSTNAQVPEGGAWSLPDDGFRTLAPVADTLYAIPLATQTTTGSPVKIIVVTGRTASPLCYMNLVSVTVESAAQYVPGSFNIGTPGGSRLDTDGCWALMGPPPPSNYLDLGDALIPGAPVGIGGGFERYEFCIAPLDATQLTGASGVLFNFELVFNTPGTYTLGFQDLDNTRRRTFYSEENETYHYWSDISNDHPGIPHSITVN